MFAARCRTEASLCILVLASLVSAGCAGSNCCCSVGGLATDDSSKECITHLHGLNQALEMYALDYDAQTPFDGRWSEALDPYVHYRTWFIDPALPHGSYGYAMNSRAVGVNYFQFVKPGNVPTFFDSSVNKADALSDLTSLPVPGRHSGFDNIVYADGHVTHAPPGQQQYKGHH